jgi:putative membrane protein
MRVLTWLFRLALFLVMMGFALSNTDTATLRFFGIPQFEWRAPLVLLLLVFFAAGVLLGALAAMPMVLRQRRVAARLRREIAAMPVPSAAGDAEVATDASRALARREIPMHGL